jgi:zinc D-Ala-D-Ala dipeptidase
MFEIHLKRFVVLVFLFCLISCSDNNGNGKENGERSEGSRRKSIRELMGIVQQDTLADVIILEDYQPEYTTPEVEIAEKPLSQIELRMIEHGLVDIQELDSSIVVELKYATSDNFLGRDVYEGMQRAYLQPDVAQMLIKSQNFLKSIESEYSIIVFDAARPRHIQQRMWDAVDAPFEEKVKFLANPANGSIHNFGAAVDVSIIDIDGNLLDMGTEFDHMGELAYPVKEKELLEQGLLQLFQVENRRLLRQVMRHGGFWGIQTEWWHFNACSRAEARERYEIIE